MFDLFPDQPNYEYPAFINVVYTLVWAFLLSSIIAITHKLTYRGSSYSNNFFQSLAIGGILTAMVMIAIGDSLARGLGVFGAMSIIRFQARIDDTRNVLFLFASLSAGVAIGVYGYSTSFAGTLVFCAAAVILHFTGFRSHNQSNVLFFTLTDSGRLPQLLTVIKLYCAEAGLSKVSINKSGATNYEYSIVLYNGAEKDKLLMEINKTEGVKNLKVSNAEINYQRNV